MMHFAWPWMALALPLPWLLARTLKPLPPQGAAIFLPFAAAVGTTAASGPPPVARWRTALLALCWLLLVGAAVRPQWLGPPQATPSSGRRVMLAVDVSGSMAARDMADNTSRLRAVQQVAGDFIAGRNGDQVGLILFGTRPYLQTPITSDLNTVRQFLDQAVVGIAGPQTAVGDAIGLAVKRLAPENGDKAGNTILILLTDGASNAGAMAPLQAAEVAASHGLRIYTIGVGAATDPDDAGAADGVDEPTMKAIAQTTGGQYFRATDRDALQQVYAQIGRLEPSAGRAQWYRSSTEWYVWPLALALLLSVPAVLVRRNA
jgi:Ca-activated chloride channel family protein